MGEGILIYGVRNKYTRNLQEFANKVLAGRRANNSVYIFGQTNKAVLSELVKRGIKLKTTQAAISDKTILKYKKHPKREKGAVVNFNRFVMVEKAVKKPKNVYIDTIKNRLAFVSSVKYSKDHVLKVIIEPNQKIGKKYYHIVKSIGIVHRRDMEHFQYKRIK